MIIKKKGLPSESDLVLCTVSKIHFNSVFVNLDEYAKQGMIHISEISPGRIRNIRDFIKEGKVIVCKVLRVDQHKGHIDLSLRRVTEAQRREKVNGMKQAQLVRSMIEFVAKQTKTEKEKLFEKIKKAISKDYDEIYPAFYDIVEGDFNIKELGLEKNASLKLDEVIRQRIKPKQVKIRGDLKLESYDSNGVGIVKNALMQAEETSPNINISYEGGAKYKVIVIAKEYKEAEEILKNAYTKAIGIVEKTGGTGDFARVEN